MLRQPENEYKDYSEPLLFDDFACNGFLTINSVHYNGVYTGWQVLDRESSGTRKGFGFYGLTYHVE